ncbi:hypothetical protein Goshw_005843 [Gossypium schwendimanii]|uniref:Uncharacterized protein n=1 Tax=Gossypium schwendimanii TaxID=34291 RepID=A0A7J9LL89_GOSSC|nr:hypothetical protein [Gossypium schwendimanii]
MLRTGCVVACRMMHRAL